MLTDLRVAGDKVFLDPSDKVAWTELYDIVRYEWWERVGQENALLARQNPKYVPGKYPSFDYKKL